MKKKPSVLISVAFAVLMLFLMLGGLLSLYSVRKSQEHTGTALEAVNMSRDIKEEMQKQYLQWKGLVLERNTSPAFRRQYHAFSYDAQNIQNMLWNLKQMTEGIGNPAKRIDALSARHQELTKLYVTVLFSDEGLKRNPGDVMREVSRHDTLTVKEMDGIIADIQRATELEIDRINSYYMVFVNSIVFVLGLAVAGLCIFLARRLHREQSTLENKVKERTADLLEANHNLVFEIEERKKIEGLLRKAKSEIEEAYARISLSEQRYRLLVEGSDDMIFVLNDAGCIISANRAMARHLHENMDDLVGSPLSDLIDPGSVRRDLAVNYINEKMQKQLPGEMPSQFKTWVKTTAMIEPKEFFMRLECIEANGTREYLGKGASVYDDVLAELLVGEWKKIAIGNSLLLAEEVSQRFTSNLGKIPNLGSSARIMIRIALREIIINAIEHGNLNISGEEKNAALEQNRYFELIAQRQADERYRDKKIDIEYALSNDRLFYRITDEGDGFDTSVSTPANDVNDTGGQLLQHGRGIRLTRSIFDSVQYSDRGNSVVLIKRFGNAAKYGMVSRQDAVSPDVNDRVQYDN